MTGAALCAIDLRFAWQVWHLVTLAFSLRGRHGRLGALGCMRGTLCHRLSLCRAGVARCDTGLRFVRQVWHLAGVALGDIDPHFGCLGLAGALGGRCGTL